jgi:hypothetical protein
MTVWPAALRSRAATEIAHHLKADIQPDFVLKVLPGTGCAGGQPMANR